MTFAVGKVDDFEQNLTVGGQGFTEPGTADTRTARLRLHGKGKLLITCRHPLPGLVDAFEHVPVGPLSGNETRRLQLRLAGLGDLGPEDRGLIDRLIGGHPRALQFVDALLRQGMGAPTVLPKLRNLARQQQVDLKCERSVPDAIGEAVRLAAADIVVDELIGLLEGPETEVLLQVAVSGLPVPLDDLAGVLDRAGVCRSDEVGPAVARLVDLTLLTDTGDGVWVHRWTATTLRERQDPAAFSARARRAAQLRRTLFDKSGQLADAIEATDNLPGCAGVGRCRRAGSERGRVLVGPESLLDALAVVLRHPGQR